MNTHSERNKKNKPGKANPEFKKELSQSKPKIKGTTNFLGQDDTIKMYKMMEPF